MGRQNRRNKNVQLQYLTIFENQILCLKTDGNWYCNCSSLKFNGKCEVCLFIKHFEELHEISTEHYLWKEKKEFYVLVRKVLLLQENILQKNGKVKEILTKEYQYKNITSANIAILKIFMDHGISKAPLTVMTVSDIVHRVTRQKP